MLRKHQADMSKIIDAIICGDGAKTILVKAVPGAGKSAIPIIASKLIDAGLADSICWVCPRKSLQDQGERNFLDPFFRNLLRHTATVRSATNDTDPCRGHAGFLTTYQAISVDESNTVLNDFRKKRYILVLDEMHHCEKDGLWAKNIAPLVELAAFRVFMTGTIQRGDDSQIAFIDYDNNADGGLVPVMVDSESVRIIEYTRTDALAEQAIIPLQFHLHDGISEWQDDEGRIRREALGKVMEKDAGAALYTALSTEYANELLEMAFSHWTKRRYDFPGSKLLIVTAGIDHAKAAAEFLGRKLQRHAIATSHDSVHAQEMIKQFKGDRLDILVAIAMAHEGMDVPKVSHIACLTHVRSTPWILQMIGRAVRVDPRFPYGSQTGFIFAPDDPFFRKIVKSIQAEQLPIAKAASEKIEIGSGKQRDLFGEEREYDNIYKITPIGSRLTGRRELPLGGQAGLFASAASMQQQLIKTPSEVESELRETIDSHVRQFAFANRFNPKKINTEIKNSFHGKPREEMTAEELDQVYKHLLQHYPLSKVRGTGIPRCSTRAVAWP